VRNKRENTKKTEIEEEEAAKHKREEEEPPFATATSASTASHQRCPVSFLLLLLLQSLFTVHVACEKCRVLHCSLGPTSPAQSKMSGPGPAWSKKILKKYFKKICDFPAYFLLNFA
jgi:hypothetical protein